MWFSALYQLSKKTEASIKSLISTADIVFSYPFFSNPFHAHIDSLIKILTAQYTIMYQKTILQPFFIIFGNFSSPLTRYKINSRGNTNNICAMMSNGAELAVIKNSLPSNFLIFPQAKYSPVYFHTVFFYRKFFYISIIIVFFFGHIPWKNRIHIITNGQVFSK